MANMNYIIIRYFFLLLELTCGIYVRFQVRDVPGPKMSSLNDFETYATNATTIVFVLDVTVCFILLEFKTKILIYLIIF